MTAALLPHPADHESMHELNYLVSFISVIHDLGRIPLSANGDVHVPIISITTYEKACNLYFDHQEARICYSAYVDTSLSLHLSHCANGRPSIHTWLQLLGSSILARLLRSSFAMSARLNKHINVLPSDHDLLIIVICNYSKQCTSICFLK